MTTPSTLNARLEEPNARQITFTIIRAIAKKNLIIAPLPLLLMMADGQGTRFKYRNIVTFLILLNIGILLWELFKLFILSKFSDPPCADEEACSAAAPGRGNPRNDMTTPPSKSRQIIGVAPNKLQDGCD